MTGRALRTSISYLNLPTPGRLRGTANEEKKRLSSSAPKSTNIPTGRMPNSTKSNPTKTIKLAGMPTNENEFKVKEKVQRKIVVKNKLENKVEKVTFDSIKFGDVVLEMLSWECMSLVKIRGRILDLEGKWKKI